MKQFFHKIGCDDELKLYYLNDFEPNKHYNLIGQYMTINRLKQIIPNIEHLVLNAHKWWVIDSIYAPHCNIYVDSAYLFPDDMSIYRNGMGFKSITLYSHKLIPNEQLFLFRCLTKKLLISKYQFYV
jgi:hypothetical protein